MTTKVSKKYIHAVIATDIVLFTIIDKELNVLLIKMNKAPYEGMWAAPGSLVQAEESIDDAAKRVLVEKSGIKNAYIEQLATFGKVNRDPFGRVVSVAYLGIIPNPPVLLTTTEEHREVNWFPVKKLPSLAYDHKEIIKEAYERLKSKLAYTNIATHIVPDEFTLSDLQLTYEIVLGKELDKRNFRKKLFEVKLVKKTGKLDIGKAHRPAELYRFVSREQKNVEIL